jgi:hypothetical protein
MSEESTPDKSGFYIRPQVEASDNEIFLARDEKGLPVAIYPILEPYPGVGLCCRRYPMREVDIVIQMMLGIKEAITGPGLTRDERFDWLLNAPFKQRQHWLRHAPIEHRAEWIIDRTIDPVGAPIDQAQLTQLLQDIEQQAHEARCQASTEHMRTTLSEIWLQLEYLIPLIGADK